MNLLKNKRFFLFLILVLSGCAALGVYEWDERYGVANPAKFDKLEPAAVSMVDFDTEVQPILNQRCVVCHACYDAPCQLNLGSYEGLTRGANKEYVYAAARFLAAEPTRLFQDAISTEQWREKDFFPVLNERGDAPEANIVNSVMAQILIQKKTHPLPDSELLPDSFDLNLKRDAQCTSIEEFKQYKKKHPLWGMPYALPGLADAEYNTLLKWIREGSRPSQPEMLSVTNQNHIKRWESFFNQDSLKAQLTSRYLFEHLYLGSIHFSESEPFQFFQLVRSATPPGQPIDLIATRRPYDDPGVERVYYRIRPMESTRVLKTHMPFLLDEARMQRWTQWFLQPDYQVKTLPSYDIELASNPFKTFEQLPSSARYRMMLDESQYIIQGYIKGPVCRGNVALNVINDLFWVAFIDPDLQNAELAQEFLNEYAERVPLPAADSSNAGLLNWIKYSQLEKNYVKSKTQFLNRHAGEDFKMNLDMLWDGDGHNENAALTIMRHYDSAYVLKGFFGGKPQTAWVITYPLLERIHYLLVAGYDVYGNVGHQLNTRIYMDFLRMEGEFNFLAFLPENYREQARDQWYQGSVNKVKEYIYHYAENFERETDVVFRTDNPLQELFNLMKDKLDPVLNKDHQLSNGKASAQAMSALFDIDAVRGLAAAQLPPVSLVEVVESDASSNFFTIISNSAYTNISHLFGEKNRRVESEDSLAVSTGIIGSYPNLFFQVKAAEMSEFAKSISQLGSPAELTTVIDRFGVRRTSSEFWSFTDRLHRWMEQQDSLEFGYLDFNRLSNL